MARPLLILFFVFALSFDLLAQPCVSTNMKITLIPTKICPGDKLTVLITKSNVYFGSGNTFTVQMSDNVGGFGSPTTIGVINDTIPDTVFYEIPMNTPAGTGYKIRVTTTSPAQSCYISDSSLTVYAKPNPNFTFPNDSQCYKYHHYYFTSTSTIGSGSITKYIWNWADGSNNDTTTGNTANHRYKFYNTYFQTELTAISDKGCRDVLKKNVNIKEMPNFDAELNDDIQCLRGNLFKIKSLSYVYTTTITNTSWNFGDGSATISNIDSAQHKYTTDGIYYINQIISLANGCKDTGNTFVLVNPHPKTSIVVNNASQCLVGNDFVFEANATVSNGLPMFNNWTIDAGVEYLQQDSVHYRYKTQGNRTIQLISITDDATDACADTAYKVIQVNPMPKASMVNYDNTLCQKGNVFRFKAKTTIPSGTVSNNWYFGDAGTLMNSDSASHTYLSSGTYSVELKSISNFGCRDSVKSTVTVNPTPVPAFTINQSTQCLKINFFKVKSASTISSGTYTRFWKISDGSSYSGVDSISTEISAVGTYSVKLFLTSNLNCKDSLIDTLRVLPMPLPDYTINNDQQCFRTNSFTFTNTSTFPGGTITSTKWDFDDGVTQTNISPVTHKYTAEGDYNVKLITYGSNTCVDTSFHTVSVFPHPGANFTINNPGQCVNNNNFIFKSNTFISSGTFTNKWLFGDGTFSNQFDNVSKKYKIDSTYVITNIAFSDHSCPDTITKNITVFPKPKTSFTIDNANQCKLGNSFTFTHSTTIKYGTYTVGWNFGDGNVDGNFVTTQHSYINPQLYKVRLIATSNNGCFDTTIKDARVYPMPVASYNNNSLVSCLAGNSFQFSATSTISNGSGMNHNWYFGDNDSAINKPLVNHSYKTDGTYTVMLISTSTTGNCKDTAKKTVKINPMPVPSFTIDNPVQCFLNNNFNFNSTSTISSGTINSYNWTFGDNTTASGPSASHSYLTVDSFSVILILQSDNNCSASDTAKVYLNPMPVADFTITPKETCLKNNSFTVTNKSKIIKGVIANYDWDYGDGNMDNNQNPAPYSYSVSGTYTVILKTTTDKGCWDTATAVVSVNPNPVMDFDVSEVCLKDSTVFTNKTTLSPGQVLIWKWTFGDGKSSALESPKHKYKLVGNYDITLTATTDKGCKETLTKLAVAQVNPLPTAKFIYQKLRSWENEVDIQYIDSSRGASSWLWNFSQMGTSTSQNPLLFYTDTVTQLTTLIVSNSFGCKDTVSEVLFITPDVIYYMPNSFSPGNDDGINDVYKPVGLAYAKSYKFIVFNRWGEMLFKTDNPQIGWDGKSGGELVEQGLYYYRIEFIGGDDLRREEKGSLMILR